ncbi:nuclear transport factor 2 family protein [Acidimicrobiaceae bacterium USS-CC1]|uniref:Nuclear transport factor 2 family protein n=1 Tax=Acidiferrimicrobium australe TaxID=2664430 RepID=A0ABW9QU13_9ACTN|nr:nuclear transport factor 2 family protein [Acidiferrimicrobium australe]
MQLVVEGLLASVEARDLDAVAAHLTVGATWANVPHAPTRGREAVCAMLAAVLGPAERVRWEVVNAAYAADRAHLERLDRFWIGGAELVAPCHGVFRVDPERGQVDEVRDYVDLGPWRAALAAAGVAGGTRHRAETDGRD